MTDTVRPVFHGFEQIPLREYAERAYLDYSMYVVLDRALPFIGDEIEWPAPGGTLLLKVLSIRYQPEAAGELHR